MAHATKLLLLTLVCMQGCVQLARQAERGLSRHSESEKRRSRADSYTTEIAVNPGHPRLFSGANFVPFSPGDPQVVQWQAKLADRANNSFNQRVIAYSPRKLLTQSREAVRRLSLFGGLYQLTHDSRYAEACKRELLNVCSFPDWQPNDFLATAEMMTAVSIGYDWIFDRLTPAERETVIDAITDKGLLPSMTAYASEGGWTTAHHNWNMVCNGSVIVASLAVMEERPDIARRTLAHALESLQNGLEAYDIAGGTPEGPMYHNYATRYLTYAAAALQMAPRSPVSLERVLPNWTQAGQFRIELLGPSGKVFNYGDCSDVVGNSAWMFWHAHQFHRPEFATFETKLDQNDPSIFDLLWYVPGDPSIKLPTAHEFEAALVMRQRWDDPNASFLALRQGSNADNHNHLDLGTFVFDMLGQRFAADLGADNYDLPGYLGNRRAEYLRSNTQGHNTLSIGDSSQPMTASAIGELLPDASGKQNARVDLTIAYPGARSVIRTAGIGTNGAISIRDDVRLSFPSQMIWHLHTPAAVTQSRDGLILELNGKRIEMLIREPAKARIQIVPDKTQVPELPLEGMTHIKVIAPASAQTRFDIEFRAVQ